MRTNARSREAADPVFLFSVDYPHGLKRVNDVQKRIVDYTVLHSVLMVQEGHSSAVEAEEKFLRLQLDGKSKYYASSSVMIKWSDLPVVTQFRPLCYQKPFVSR